MIIPLLREGRTKESKMLCKTHMWGLAHRTSSANQKAR